MSKKEDVFEVLASIEAKIKKTSDSVLSNNIESLKQKKKMTYLRVLLKNFNSGINYIIT